MSKDILINELENLGTALRINRNRVRDVVLNNPQLIPYLVEITFEVDNKLSIKASWVLELVCEQNINLIIPHLDTFCKNIGTVKFDSAVRPISKICNFLAIYFNKRTPNSIKKSLTNTHIDLIIGNNTVATKAYAMNALYIFGKNKSWVHQELKLIILQNIPKESAAYKSRGKITLKLIIENQI